MASSDIENAACERQTLVSNFQALQYHAAFHRVQFGARPLGCQATAKLPGHHPFAAMVEQNNRTVSAGSQRLVQSDLVPMPQHRVAHKSVFQDDVGPAMSHRQLMHEIVGAAFWICRDFQIGAQAFRFLEAGRSHIP